MSVKIEIYAGIRIHNLPKSLEKQVMDDLTYENAKYKNAKKYGQYMSSSLLPYNYYYSVEDDYLYTPRGYISRLTRLLKNNSIPFEINDRTLCYVPQNFTFKAKLRDYQEDACSDLAKYPIGFLEAGTGAGKTVSACNMVVFRQQPTLIIVHTKELLLQWVERIKQFIGEDAGIIGDGKYDIRPITVGIINSVAPRVEQLSNKFGHVICDEAHRILSPLWVEVISQLPAKYLLGLTATPFRSDGQDKYLFDVLGPKMHTVDASHLYKTGAVLIPEIKRVITDFKVAKGANYQTMMKKLVTSEYRNNLAINEISNYYKETNNPFLVVSDRTEQCVEFCNRLKELGIEAVLLTGKMTKKDRQASVDMVRSGKAKCLVATVSLLAEGFDAPALYALFMLTPIKFEGRLIQIVGRVLRPEEGKVATIFDFRDKEVPSLVRQARERDKTYKSVYGK